MTDVIFNMNDSKFDFPKFFKAWCSWIVNTLGEINQNKFKNSVPPAFREEEIKRVIDCNNVF